MAWGAVIGPEDRVAPRVGQELDASLGKAMFLLKNHSGLLRSSGTRVTPNLAVLRQ